MLKIDNWLPLLIYKDLNEDANYSGISFYS